MSAVGDTPADDAVSGRRRWLEWLDARLNPMLVKDLRLSMRVQGVLWIYFLALLASVTGSGLYAFMARSEKLDGVGLLPWVYGVTSMLVGAVIPFMVYNRFRQELLNRATELVLMTAMTPRQLMRGKLLSAWCSSLLVISAAAPAMLTIYLLGGVDANLTLFMAVCLVWTALTMPCVQLLMATFGSNNLMQLASILIMLGQLVWVIGTNFLLYFLMRAGDHLAGAPGLAMLWGTTGTLTISGGLLGYFCYRTAMGQLCSPVANRDLAPRLTLMAAIGSFLVLMLGFYFAWQQWLDDALRGTLPYNFQFLSVAAVAVGGCTYLFLICFLVLCMTAETPSRRLRNHWPRSHLIGLLFYPGSRRLAAYGLLNFLLLLAVLGGLFLIDHYGVRDLRSGHVVHSVNTDAESLFRLWVAPFLAFGYGMVVHLGVVLPWVKRHGERPPTAAASLLGVNIGLALLTTVLALLVQVRALREGFLPLALALSPFGIVISELYAESVRTTVLLAGLAEAAAIGLLLGLLAISPALEETRNYRRDRRGLPRESPEQLAADAADAAEDVSGASGGSGDGEAA